MNLHQSWLENPFSVDLLIEQLLNSAKTIGLTMDQLATVDSYPLLFLHNDWSQDKPSRLIAAGFHGDEPAGPWGILAFLSSCTQELLDANNIGFLPLVNPTGLKAASRTNRRGEDPNRGFCHRETSGLSPSYEGEILLSNQSVLLKFAQNGFLSLHEDIDASEYYLYTFNKNNPEQIYTPALMNALSKYFAHYDETIIEGQPVVNSVISNYCDGSFEDYLFHTGISFTACTETPGKADFNTRVKATENIIDTFLKII